MSIVEELTFTREDCGPAPSTVIAIWLRPSKLIGNVVALSFCAFMGCLLSYVALSYLLRTARFRPSTIGSPGLAGQRQGSFHPSCRAATAGVESPTPPRAERPWQAGRAKPGLR